jgi:hypothetical protein
MLALELRELNNDPLPSYSFGTVPAGSSSQDRTFQVVNTGDAALSAPVAWIEQASTSDGQFQATIGNIAVTGTSRATATVLPAIAVGASLSGSAVWINPAGSPGVPVDTALLRIEPL